MRIKHWLLFSITLVFFQANAQEIEKEKLNIIEQRVDFLLDVNEGGEADFTTLFEQLEFYYSHPININTTDRDELEKLGLLNAIQINNLLLHIEQNGKLIHLEELQTIQGFDVEGIRLISPFIKINGDLDRVNISPKNVLKEGKSTYFLRYSRILEKQKGFQSIDAEELEEFPNRRYLGSADKLYSRYRFNYANNFSAGFTTEKDAGEELFQGEQQKGFDFYSAHLFAQGFGSIKQLALGDFQAQFGQGLTFWSGLAFGRSPSIFTLKRNAPKLRPYTSVQEDLFLRGGGITLVRKQFELTLFYSSKKQDANVIGRDSLNNEIIILSLSEHGFHRTRGELMDRKVIRNSYLGGNISYEKRNFSIGFTGVHNEVDATLQARQSTYKQFSQLDNSNSNIGSDFSYLYRNFNVFGEWAKSIDGGYGYTLGALIVLDPNLSLGIQNRHFERDFKPIQSNAIGEGSANTNEKGTFLGIEAKLSKGFNLSAYADRFVFPWLRFQTDAPSEGSRLFAQLNYKPSKKMETYFRFRKRSKGKNNSNSQEQLKTVVQEENTNYRLHLSYQLSSNIQLKNRIEYTAYQLGSNKKEKGLLIYQDIAYRKLGSPLSFSLRYAFFETDTYNSRIYAYEQDVLYAFSIPAYNGRGSRFYFNIKLHFNRNIDLWIRYAQTYYTDREIIGGNTKSEIKAQLRLKF